MLFAQQKLNENIAEHILYMYQVEDLIRAYNFDVDALCDQYVRKQVPSDSIFDQYKIWYTDLVKEMKRFGVEKAGHLNRVNEIQGELNYLHNTIIMLSSDEKYKTLFDAANEHIEEFRKKSNLGEMHVIEVAFHALYMKMLLKMQKKDISAESEIAFDSMRILLAYLSRAYHKMKSGDLEMFNKN